MTNIIFSEKDNNSCPIGVLDSGVGGLTVLSELKKILPDESYVYYGDTKNLPYGSKTPEQLYKFVSDILDFLVTKNVKAVVFGCNTTAAVVYEKIKTKYNFPIYPIIQDACKKIRPEQYKKIGIFATEATVKSKAYTKSLQKFNNHINVMEIACPQWVGLVENNKTDSNEAFESVKAQMLIMQKFNPEKIILGCTHYPYLTEVLYKFTDKEKLINPAKLFAEFVKNDLKEKKLLTNKQDGACQFFVSDNPEKFFTSGRKFFNIPKIDDIDLITLQ